ncbi:uncharacterized protein LOC109118340 [Fukomys damarensis]|uniref:uncharacterized protein LOC109118340 n=1 Tax=Fukomys damarensis TaxID=885580 RepID=UPI0008FEBA7B|nr:uncharacterized protein LOC109118340 [Fukomys damarensis]
MVPNGIKSAKRQAPRPVFSQEPDPLEPTDPGLRPLRMQNHPLGRQKLSPSTHLPRKKGRSRIPPPLLPVPEGALSAYGPPEVPQERPDPVPVLPLREVEQGHYVYIPFSTSDLYNWKHQNPPFSEKPQALISLLESVFNTHDSTWDDCQQLLQALFTSEERERIRRHAIRSVLGEAKGLVEDQQQQARVEAQLPISHPKWESNSTGGREALHNYHQHLLAGLRGAARKPTNLSKV